MFSTTVFPFEGIFDLDSAAVVDTGFDVDLQKKRFLSQILIKSNALPRNFTYPLEPTNEIFGT